MKTYIFAVLTAFLTVVLLPAADDGFVLAENGATDVEIVVQDRISGDIKKWSKDLASYLKAITKADFKVVKKSGAARQLQLKVERDDKRDPEEFSFRFPDENTVVISGRSANALKYGIYDFLERYCGVRYLAPGKDWEHVPELSKVVIPRKEIVEAPEFLSRHFGNGSFKANHAFYMWSREKLKANNYRIFHGENMSQTFPVARYGKSNPEFYPVFNGKRYLPKIKEHSFWQPCYTEPGLARLGAETVCRNIKSKLNEWENPRRNSYSLGINDSNGFCECERCLKADRNLPRNPFSDVHRSGSYYTFINNVADAVVKEIPEAKLGFIAYAGVTAVPENIKLNDHLVPHVCVELFQWVVPQRRAQIQKLYTQWRNAGVREMGSYDYFWGGAYLIPRVYCRSFADTVKWLYGIGVRHYRAECSQDIFHAEGPKFYTAMKLLWDPALDVEKVLDDWYLYAVGRNAAPYLKEYFDNLEKFWTVEAVKTPWFGEKNVTYLKAGNTTYLTRFPESELVKNRKLLEKAVELAETPAQKKRAGIYLAALNKYAPAVRQNHANLELLNKLQKLSFNTVLADYTFDKKPFMLSKWQRKNTRVEFRREAESGLEHTAALAIDLSQAKKAPGAYVIFRKYKGKQVIKASVWARSDGNVSNNCKLSLSLQWRDSKRKQLGAAFNSTAMHKLPKSGEWRKLEVYGIAPHEEGTYSISMTGSHSDGGVVFFDNLKIESAEYK